MKKRKSIVDELKNPVEYFLFLETNSDEAKKEKRKMKRLKIFILVSSILFLLTLAYEVIFIIKINTNNIMEYKSYSQTECIKTENRLTAEFCSVSWTKITKDEIKKLIEEEIPMLGCIEIERNLQGDKKGLCLFLIGVIIIDKGLDNNQYAKALTHERIHLKTKTGCERYVQYKTFVTLYESKNTYLHKVGIQFALDILKGRFSREYDCSAQIIDYFLQKEAKGV